MKRDEQTERATSVGQLDTVNVEDEKPKTANEGGEVFRGP